MYWYIQGCIDAYCKLHRFLVKLTNHVSMHKSCVSMHVNFTLICIDAQCVCIDAQADSSSHVSMQVSCVSMHRVFGFPCIDAWFVCIDAYWTRIVLWLITGYMYRCKGSCIDTYWHKMHFNCYFKGNFQCRLICVVMQQ